MEPGELRRIARTISTVENQAAGYQDILGEAYRLRRWADRGFRSEGRPEHSS